MIYELTVSRKAISVNDAPSVSSPQLAAEYARKYIYKPESMWREQCWAIMVDRKNCAISHALVSIGGADACSIDVRTVLMFALQDGARAIVLVHNHPSGNPVPGKLDIEETARLKKAASVVGILVLDHIILAENSYYSFQEERIINE